MREIIAMLQNLHYNGCPANITKQPPGQCTKTFSKNVVCSVSFAYIYSIIRRCNGYITQNFLSILVIIAEKKTRHEKKRPQYSANN